MLGYMYKSHLQTLILKHRTLNNLNHCLSRPIIRSYRIKKIIPTNVDSLDFKISFLQNKCGLSGKPLINACKCLNFDSSDQRPDSVLELLRNFGFPQPNITKIISSAPRVLKEYHPQNSIKPKLDFLLSISQSHTEVVAIVNKNPLVLARSLNNHLIPSLNLLNSVTGSYTNTVSVLKYNPYILSQNVPKSFMLNTQFLLTLGVTHSQILKLLKSCGPVLGTPHDKFRNFVSKLTDMAFHLESSYFLHALRTLTCVNDTTWESRCVVFRSFGFTNDDILFMFKRIPLIMCLKEKTINNKLEFFLNKLQWTPYMLLSNPDVLPYSLEKRTIPRCSVLEVLVSKNNISENYMLLTILSMPERRFVKDFVIAYKDDVPQVMEAYEGKLRFDEYTFKQKGQLRSKPL